MVPQSAFLPQKKKAQVDEADELERVVTTGGDPLGRCPVLGKYGVKMEDRCGTTDGNV